MSDLDDDADDRVRDALEARLIQEEVEAAAEQLHRNTRSLGELLLDWADAGHQVRIEIGGRHWDGSVCGVAENDGAGVVVLRTEDERVEIDLAAVTTASRVAGSPTSQSLRDAWIPGSLIARLRWCLTQDPPPMVTIGHAHFDPVSGLVVAVSNRHVELAQGDAAVAVKLPTYVVLAASTADDSPGHLA